MNVAAIVILCVCAAVLCKLTDRYAKEYSLFIVLAAAGIIMAILIGAVTPVMEKVSEITAKSGIPTKYTEIMFKALGICYITQLGSDVCKDSGETALSTQAELAGKLALVITALPLFSALIDIIGKVIYL